MIDISSSAWVATSSLIAMPFLSFLISWKDFFNLGKKESEEFFDKVDQWIKRSKVDNLRDIIFPSGIGVCTDQEISLSDDALKGLASRIDNINLLERILNKTRLVFEIYYLGLALSFIAGTLGLALTMLGVLNLEAWFTHNVTPIVLSVVIYTLGGFMLLWFTKKNLEKSYKKEYDI